jgi:hypothetical protein
VAVELDEAERPHVVLERQDRPGVMHSRCAVEHGSFGQALQRAEVHLLARGGLLGAEAEGLAGARVARELAESMFDERGIGRFVHLPAGRSAGG